MTNQKPETHEITVAEVPHQGHGAPLDPFLQMIAAAAKDPDTNVEKLTALYDLMKRRDEDQQLRDQETARIEFDDALARAQATFPIIPERGRIKMHSKADRMAAEKSSDPEAYLANRRPMQNTPYALWEDVVEGITPSLSREGLSLSFAPITQPAGDAFKIIVRGFLKRRGVTVSAETPPLQHDSTGSKNSIQAIKSTTSYGKTMVAGFLTNFASRGESDDGQGGAPVDGGEGLSAENIAYLKAGIAQTGTDLSNFLDLLQAPSVEEMNETQFKIAVEMLQRKAKAMKPKAEKAQ